MLKLQKDYIAENKTCFFLLVQPYIIYIFDTIVHFFFLLATHLEKNTQTIKYQIVVFKGIERSNAQCGKISGRVRNLKNHTGFAARRVL